MAFLNYDKLSKSEFYSNVPAKDGVQKTNLGQLEFKANDTYKKDEKITTTFESSNPEDVITKAYLDTELYIVEDHISLMEKEYNKSRDVENSNIKSDEEILIERAVKTNIQIVYEKVYLLKMQMQSKY